MDKPTQQTKINRYLFILILFLTITLFHGIFSSGFIPILNNLIKEKASFAYSVYFIGYFIGQVLIYKFWFFSKFRFSYPFYEILFGCTLIFMAFYSTPTFLSLGRFLEGITAGLTIPLIFASVLNSKVNISNGTKLVVFNSLNALGFVIGPVIIGYFLNYFEIYQVLTFFGLIFICLSLLFNFLPLDKIDEPTTDYSFKQMFSQGDWYDKFSSLFIAKSFYGFLLSFAAGHILKYFNGLSMTIILLIFSGIFVLGQVIINPLMKAVGKNILEKNIPILMGISLLCFFFFKLPHFLVLASLLHSMMVFIGYLNFGMKSTSAREFALFNSLTDSATILGAFLATFAIYGTIALSFIMFIPIYYLLYEKIMVK